MQGCALICAYWVIVDFVSRLRMPAVFVAVLRDAVRSVQLAFLWAVA